MTVRRFGPVNGAGVQIEEKEGDQQIIPAPLGVTCLIGEFSKGPVQTPGFPSGRIDYVKRYGPRRLLNAETPTAALDFYRLGRGTGELIPYRVTAGDEEKAYLDVYTRQADALAPDSGRRLFGRLYAKNGGKWGGQRATYLDEITGAPDLTETTLDTGDAMIENEWAGGRLELKKVTTKTYRIVGNTAAGVISVEADQTLLTDWNAGVGTPANRYVLTRENLDRLGQDFHLSALFKDGQENPGTEFGIEVYEDGVLAIQYNNLSTDPVKVNYWVRVINDDKSNHWFTVEDLYVGDKTLAEVRPANLQGLSVGLTPLTLTVDTPDATVNSLTGADPTILVALNAKAVPQTIIGTVENGGADIRWTTSIGPLEVVQAAFTGVLTDLGDESIDVTVTNGGTPLADGDTIVIEVLALIPGELVGGLVWPDVVNEPNLSFIIASNTANTVSVRAGLDLTDGGAIAPGEVFRLQYAQEFGGGHDGSPVTDADFLDAFDTATSTINKIFGKNKGLVKLATPGIVSATVVKAGLEYAAARNYQFGFEIPENILGEAEAIDHVNSTIGRTDYGFTYFPTFGYTLDPDATPGTEDIPLRLQSLLGMILGRHALTAFNFDGYHKAPAGIEVTLPDVLKLTTGDSETAVALNEEMLNPQGLNVVKFRQGTVIVWGDRTISPTAEWKWLHQRSMMSHYENVLRENFDWIIFAINNQTAWQRAATALRSYFLTEWTKGALRGKSFEEAMKLKLDSENNTDLTLSQGDLNAEITLKLADTVERFRIVIGKAGIFDAVV